MFYRGKFVISSRQIDILRECDDKMQAKILAMMFKRDICGTDCAAMLEKEPEAVKLAFRLLDSCNPAQPSATQRNDAQESTTQRSHSSPLVPPSNKKGPKNYPSPLYPPNSIYFDQFWEAYPRKVGKGAAITAFSKAMPKEQDRQKELLEQMLKTLDWQKRTEQWQDAAFIPHPSTWLNQRRWEDEPVLSTEEAAEIKAGEACKNINREMDELTRNLVAELGGGENENRS